MQCLALLLLAVTCFRIGQLGLFKEAVTDFTTALSIDPKNANAYCNRGSSLEKMNHLSEAINDYTRAIALDPRNSAAYNSRGLALDR
jgi:Flp pilus assembly protein TadD